MNIDDLLNRRIPAAIVLALIMQGSAVVWWASAKDSDVRFQQQRIDHVEQAVVDTSATQNEMLQRLARIEERLNAQTLLLERMDRRVGKDRP